MKSLFAGFLLLLMLLTPIITAEEIDTLSIPSDEDTKEGYPVRFRILDYKGQSSSAILHITSDKTPDTLSINVEGVKEISLPKGLYTAKVDGGARSSSKPLKFSLPSETNNDHTITLTPYAPVEPAGWIMLDPLFISDNTHEKPALTEVASSLELRAIFTPFDTTLKDATDFNYLHNRDGAIIAPVTPYLNPEFGELLAFNSPKFAYEPQRPVVFSSAVFPLLASLSDSNHLTALGHIVSYINRTQIARKSSEEFIFDTISGPLYDLLLLDDFDSSVKVWHSLLNQNYRIPAIYSGGSDFYKTALYPSVKGYVKIARKTYTQKMLHKALEEGKSIISNGPFIRFFVESIGSKGSGQKTGLDNDEWINGRSLKIGGLGFTSKGIRNIYAEAFTCSNPEDKIKSIELIYNGKTIQRKVGRNEQKKLSARWQVQLEKPGWLQLRYISTNGKFHAITNPIYLVDHKANIPAPAIAKTQIQVIDAKSGRPINAKIMVENFGIVTDSTEISEHAIILQTPATADIIVEASGYKSEKKSIYLDGGGAKYIKSLVKKKVLDKAHKSPIAYGYLRKALLNSKLIFKLNKK